MRRMLVSFKRKFRVVICILTLGPIAILFTNAVTASTYAFSREQRLSRFHYFLTVRKEMLLRQGATLHKEEGPAGLYQQANLLDPRFVASRYAFAINRYNSYLKRISTQMSSENLVTRSLSFGVLTKPPGFVAPEEFDSSVGSEMVDATTAVRRALATSNVWLTPGKTYVLSEIILIPRGRRMVSDGSGTLLIKTGPGTSFNAIDRDCSTHKDIDQGIQPIRITDVSDVVLRDFRVRMASEEGDTQPLLRGGIQVNNSSNVSIQGLELLGFPRTLGIIRVNSGKNIFIEDNLIHGSYTKSPTRQVTGIEIDNDQINSVNSENIKITGNFILGVMLDKEVFFDTFYRGSGMALGYETDGINLAAYNSKVHLVANNSIMDVGEGIDTFFSNGEYRNNHIERAFAYGLKLVHSASGNRFYGNRVLATGLSSIVIADSQDEPTGGNTFIKNRIRYVGAFDVASIPQKIPLNSIAAIHLMDYTKKNVFIMNEASEYMFTNSPLWKGSVFCTWPTDSSLTAASNANWFWKNGLNDSSANLVFKTDNSECFRTNTLAPLLASTNYENWTADGVRVEPNVRQDVFGEKVTVDRAWSSISGQHDLNFRQDLGNWQNRDFTFSVLARRGTNSQLMLRDQIGDWLATFDLNGGGHVISQVGSPIRSASIVPLSDDWYLLSVNFWATHGSVLLTLRQLSSGPEVFLDLGEARLDQ